MIEDLTVKKDGSGTYKVSLNLSQSKTQIDKIRTQDSILKYKVPTSIDVEKQLESAKQIISAQEGISNTSIKFDHVNYLYHIQFDFTNISQLNKAIQTLWKTYDKQAPDVLELYTFSSGKFMRQSDNAHISHIVSKAGNQEVEMCRSATYRIICRFEEPIASTSSNYYTLSPSKKAAMYKNDLWTTLSYKQASNVTFDLNP
ncbi:MAG: hypothetical protein MUE33_10995 [Cytophagaceae bacterium]|jgi:hypothetical protein|nr:hypothetical protein [Cytophagaceae bacterium]